MDEENVERLLLRGSRNGEFLNRIGDEQVDFNAKRRPQGHQIAAVPLLLFPKPFEMFSFLCSIEQIENAWINDAKLDNVKMFSLTYKHEKTGFKFHTYVHSLDSSDIDFSFKLGRFIKTFQSANKSVTLHITLAGTCGGSHKFNRRVGEAFRITKAVKFDRGSLSKNGNSVILSIDKPGMALTIASTTVSWGETILSCNHVVCVDPVEFAPLLNLDITECTLCDMETFEFFSTCCFMGIPEFDCVRVVSDVFKDGSDRDLEKLTRKHVNMIGILELLTEQSFETALYREYTMFKEPPEAEKLNHAYLLERMKNSIRKLRSSLVAAYVAVHPGFDIEAHMRDVTGN